MWKIGLVIGYNKVNDSKVEIKGQIFIFFPAC